MFFLLELIEAERERYFTPIMEAKARRHRLLAEAEKIKAKKTDSVARQKLEALERERERLQRQFIKEEMEKEVNQLQTMEEERCREGEKFRQKIRNERDRLKHLTDLTRNNQRQELSEALGFPEEQPIEVLDTYLAIEKGKISITERRTLAARQQQLIRYQVQARDQAGQLLKHKYLLKGHIDALKERKEKLEKLEGGGEKYTKELTECNQQLEQLQAKLELAQAQLRSCKERFQEYKEEFEKCLDEMNKCEATLSQSQQELKRCLDRLQELRRKLTVELQSLDQQIQHLTEHVRTMGIWKTIGYWIGLYNCREIDLLPFKQTELEHCNNELEKTESALTKCKENLEEFEMELRNLKKCIKEEVISHIFAVPHEHAIASQPPSEEEQRFDPTKESQSTSTTTVSCAQLLQVSFPNVTLTLIVYIFADYGVVNHHTRVQAYVIHTIF